MDWDVGAVDSLKGPGDFLTFEADSVPILVIRDWQGCNRAFINICRHQNVQLEWDVSGRCNTVITCPFHGWTYGFDGVNLSPGFGEDAKLHPLRLREEGDRLWVSVPKEAAELCVRC